MTNFQFEGELDLMPDDELSIVEGVRRGDLVYFERVAEHHVRLRTLAAAEPRPGVDSVYRVDRGDEPGTVKFTMVSQPSA